MGFVEGDLIIPMMAEDGVIVGRCVSRPIKSNDLVCPMKARDRWVGTRVQSLTNQDDYGFGARSSDKEIVGVVPACGAGMLLVFIDESSQYKNNASLWNQDVSKWNAQVAQFGSPESFLVNVPGKLASDVIGGPLPPDIEIQEVSRSPSLDEFKQIFKKAGGGRPVEVVFGIDSSGSMTRRTIEPGIDQFEDWLDEKEISYSEDLYSNERWLGLMADTYKDFRERIN